MANQQQGQFPGSLWMPHTAYWPGRGGHSVRYIIVHGTATPGIATAQGIAKLFQSRGNDSAHGGTHYIVGKDGTVVQGVREEDSAWGNGVISAGHDPWWGTRGNPNLETISIEHVKVGAHNEDAITEAQMQASFALIAYLVQKWKIPARWADSAGGITGHFSIDPVNRKYCPGLYPWDELFHSLLAPSASPGLPATATAAYVLREDGLSPVPVTSTSSGPPPLVGNPSPGNGPTAVVSYAGSRAHAALQELPGFGGIAVAVDQAEQFEGLSLDGPGSVFGWVGSNAFALVVRLLLILCGVVVLVGLLVALARGNDWLGDAGGDVLPLALQGMHPVRPQRAQPTEG